MRSRFLALELSTLLLTVSVLAGCATSAPARRGAKRLPLEPCKVAGVKEKLLCGTYEVWEDREARSGRKIPLNIVVVPARDPAPAPDPLFAFGGGPGEGITGSAGFYAELVTGPRQKRDVVLIDQRGTGGSNRLQCQAPGGADDLQGYFEPTFSRELAESCRAELEKKADLTLYTTSIAMDDIDEVRDWLGYGTINLEGGSYGTRAVQVYMRRHPETVRAAIMLGTTGIRQHLPLYHARDGKRGVDRILARCAADEACHGAFPHLAEEHAALMARLDAEPARVDFPHPETGEPVPLTITREVFSERIRHGLYTVGLARAVPLMIHRAWEGDFLPVARLGIAFEAVLNDLLALGMYLSVTCAEDIPFIRPEDVAPLTDGTYLGDSRIRSQTAACGAWPRGKIPEDFHAPIREDIPTLLISGDYDPVTPPSWAEETASHLPRGLHVLIPEAHHGFYALSNLDCALGLAEDFLARGSIEGLDPSCVETMERPPFLTKADELEELLGQFAN